MSDLTHELEIASAAENGQAQATNAHAAPAEPAATAARYVVSEYLRDVGLRDPELIARESQQIVEKAWGELSEGGAVDETALSEAAINLTVKQLDQWFLALAANAPESEDPRCPSSICGARLPALLSRYPEALKQQSPTAEVVDSLRDELIAVVPTPRPRPMRRQPLTLVPVALSHLRRTLASLLGREQQRDAAPTSTRKVILSRGTAPRLLLAILSLLSTILGTWQFSRILARDGFTVIDYALTVLFAVLFLWVAASFWIATFGLVVILRRPRRGASSQESEALASELPPTAIVMPIYNEDPHKVFANIRAIAHSLEATGAGSAFSIFVLSDTTDPDVWLEEERTWAKHVAKMSGPCRVFYRHRAQNTSRKAGNIADFCRRWGEHYRYMVVLDADSLMAGETVVELVRRMERDPQLGILQAPPRPVNRQSPFARMQQFAAYLYGPVFLEGFALWSECDGNYWGHNAIIRIRPFMAHCELPVLPGDGPLSGEILSHDFVEAALMRRAGWKVCLAHDLDQSYEECPTTILDFAQRDQRWCQGNLQHARLLLAEGLHPASRLHFGMGVMSYLASPLWLAFLVLTVIAAFSGIDLSASGSQPPGGTVLFVITMSMLLLPKLWGVIATFRQPQSPAGGLRALTSVLIETMVSILIAPIMMLLHTRFVVSTLLGSKVKWSAQRRDEWGISLGTAFSMHYGHTLFGLAVAAATWFWAPGLLPWLLPVIAGLVLSIPLAMLLGNARLGKWLARQRLMMIPEEVSPPAVLQYQREALDSVVPDQAGLFATVVCDPAFYALHIGILRATESHLPLSSEQFQETHHLLRTGGVASAPPELRRAALGDRQAMERLHVLVRSHVPPPRSALLT